MLKYIHCFSEESMKAEVEEFFLAHGIEYFAAVSYSDVRETSPEIMKRETFVPKSVIVFLVPYFAEVPKNISVYAASLDYHIFFKEFSAELIRLMKTLYPENSFVGYGDHSPIDERGAALIGGLGLLGENGLLINEKYGSFVFIGDLVCDVEPGELSAVKHEIKFCPGCGSCRAACPTGILRAEGEDCLSAITQRKGGLSENEALLMQKFNTVWGCDLCQSACPYNKSPAVTPIEFFHKERIDELTEDVLASLSKEDLKRRAFGWRGRAVLLRNLEIEKKKTKKEN